MKDWRKMLEEVGGYENELTAIPAAGVREMVEEIESLREQVALAQAQQAKTFIELSHALERADKQLATRDKQIVMLREFVKLLRDYIPASAVGNMTVQEALDATDDLKGVRL